MFKTLRHTEDNKLNHNGRSHVGETLQLEGDLRSAGSLDVAGLIKGNVFDPLGGLSDLKAGRIRFVGNANVRIEEDLLRLLRYFRFYAYYGRSPADEKALTACSQMASRIEKLSVERVWNELSRLLLAPNPASAVTLMQKHAILPYLLPEAIHCDILDRLVKLEKQTKTVPDYLRRIAVMVSLSREEACLLTK